MTARAVDFPIPAVRPDDGELTWFRETSIAPDPVPELDFAYLGLVFDGFATAGDAFFLPVRPRLEEYLAAYGGMSDGLMALSVPSWRETPNACRRCSTCSRGRPTRTSGTRSSPPDANAPARRPGSA